MYLDRSRYGDTALDSTLKLCDTHPCAGPPLAENDDDERAAAGSGSLASYLEWMAPPCTGGAATCTYYIDVAGYGQSVGTFAAILSEMPDACGVDVATGVGGMVLADSSATISFNPAAGTATSGGHMMCDWLITCPDPTTRVHLTFDTFQLNADTNSGDHVTLYDGAAESAHKFRPTSEITGSLVSLPQTTWESSTNSLLMQFTSDETAPVPGEGFEAYYDCVPSGPVPYLDSIAPCQTGGAVLSSATGLLSFRPSDNQGHMECDWLITCPDPATHPRFTFDAFQLNPDMTSGDHVALLDGPDASAHKFRPNGQVTGLLQTLPQTTWDGSGSSILVQFTSDESAPRAGEGFEAHYDCV